MITKTKLFCKTVGCILFLTGCVTNPVTDTHWYACVYECIPDNVAEACVKWGTMKCRCEGDNHAFDLDADYTAIDTAP
jgi:hypothetical protein